MKSTQKHLILKIVLIILGVFLVLGIVGIVLARQSLQNFNDVDKPQLIQVVDQFIKDINENKPSDAYQLIDGKDLTLDAFVKALPEIQVVSYGYLRQDSTFKNVKIISFAGGKKQVTYSTTIYFSDNTQGEITIAATKIDEKWFINLFYPVASARHIQNAPTKSSNSSLNIK